MPNRFRVAHEQVQSATSVDELTASIGKLLDTLSPGDREQLPESVQRCLTADVEGLRYAAVTLKSKELMSDPGDDSGWLLRALAALYLAAVERLTLLEARARVR